MADTAEADVGGRRQSNVVKFDGLEGGHQSTLAAVGEVRVGCVVM